MYPDIRGTYVLLHYTPRPPFIVYRPPTFKRSPFPLCTYTAGFMPYESNVKLDGMQNAGKALCTEATIHTFLRLIHTRMKKTRLQKETM